ncbi:diaminopimelate epimerase [Actinoalloteichus hymeniacidonis]|uniref:Diaminopimelate epimerase n=1 Tax=Actinoalloteichus hymeniacidonis TaxID=340345 RepID=A0AAC9HNH6_9PSEU|nr:diaminopimelate epimerase [Actinoalloteichus hymeniacidonis]AOS62527.1 diaminopimelate epimerase [Actinoalloteichus hymeniacidonis]MBB5909442.1 diaminopimelate epimerase [Actinoalloteichus hymeniacidonis]
MADVRFSKGHGTQNDFVILPDPDGDLELTEHRVRALCDRRRGIGADGVLRVVRSAALNDSHPGVPEDSWFMDYRNSDGSIVEMCGNGVRVFAHYLVESGLAAPGEFVIGTRSGPKGVLVGADGTVTVDMGRVRIGAASTAAVGGRTFDGIAVDVGNPHLACVIGAADDGQTEARAALLTDLDLTVPPAHDPVAFPHGVNVEFIVPIDSDRAEMRVHERGVGETRSCGTGTVAAVAAALRADGRDTGRMLVNTLGGPLTVTIGTDDSQLTGSAVLVAEGSLDALWWQQADVV